MKEFIISICAIILAAVIFFLIKGELSKSNELKQHRSEIEFETMEFSSQKKALQAELKALKNNLEEKKAGTISLILSFTQLDERFSTEILPLLNENKITATLCLSDETIKYFEQEDSTYSISDLTDLGWSIGVYWNGEQDLQSWALSLSESNSYYNEGLSILFIDRYNYQSELNDIICSLGFNHVIIKCNGNTDVVENTDNRLNIINAFNWNTTASSQALSNRNISGSQVVFLIGTEGKELAYESSQFNAMISTAMEKVDNKEIIITDPDGALQRVAKNVEEYSQAVSEYEDKSAKIEAEIAELDDKIDRVYDEYFEKNER